MNISEGAVLVPRQIIYSQLWETKPVWWFKVWLYILVKANFKHHNRKNTRGSLLTTYEELHTGCRLGNLIKVYSIDNVIRYLKSTGYISTQKTTRGFIITVCNYDQIQSFSTYKNDTENITENEAETEHERYDNGTKETKEPFYNYQEISFSYKEKDLDVTPNLGSTPQPDKKPQAEVVFRRNLKKVKLSVDSWLKKCPDSKLDELFISRNTDAAIEGIIYYIQRYKFYCGLDHVFYKTPQLQDCLLGFLDGIWYIERCGIDKPINEVIIKVVNRWFETTSPESNNLRLSHFSGQNSLIFYRALTSVMGDFGLAWREANDDS